MQQHRLYREQQEARNKPIQSNKDILLGKLCNLVPSNIFELVFSIAAIVGLVVFYQTKQIPAGLIELLSVLAITSGKGNIKSLLRNSVRSSLRQILQVLDQNDAQGSNDD